MCRQSADFVQNQTYIVISTRQKPTPSMKDIRNVITRRRRNTSANVAKLIRMSNG